MYSTIEIDMLTTLVKRDLPQPASPADYLLLDARRWAMARHMESCSASHGPALEPLIPCRSRWRSGQRYLLTTRTGFVLESFAINKNEQSVDGINPLL